MSLPPSITPLLRTAQPLVLASNSSQLTPQAGQVPSNGINVKASFDAFIEQYSQMVILQRLDLSIHCSHCWKPEYGEGDPQCPYCLGRGYASVFERHQARRVSSLNEHRTQLAVQSAPGVELVDEIFWFFESTVNPQEEDAVYEVSWKDATMTLPDHLIAAYWITYADPMRAGGGAIAFWRASAMSKPIDRSIIGQHLRQLVPSQMTVPIDGVIRYSTLYPS